MYTDVGDCPCWECLERPRRGILKLFSRVNVFQVSGTNHSLPLGEKVPLHKEFTRKEKGIWRSSALTLVNFYVRVCCFPRRLLTGSMLFGQHVTIISQQPSQMSLSLRWELNRAWSSLGKHSMEKHFLTSSDRVSVKAALRSREWTRRGRKKGHTE